MKTLIAAAALACWAGAAAAQGDAAFASPGCRTALAALDEAETGGAAKPRDAAAVSRIEARRKTAAAACLGADADHATEPQRLAQPPVSVYPPPADTARLRIALPQPPRPAAPLPPVPAAQPPISLTNCDAAGCWTSDGTRLNRMGSTLVGPGGACSAIGNIVRCP